MNYKNIGFRALDNAFCCFENTGIFDQIIQEHLLGSDSATHILTYGYIDRMTGLSIEILACVQKLEEGKYRFFPPNELIRTYARIAAVENIEFEVLKETPRLRELYAEKLKVLDAYQVSDDIEAIRQMEFLDSCRDKYNIDDILVHISKPGFQTEGCWVRVNELLPHSFKGEMLNEPYQDLGIHIGDEIEFVARRLQDGQIICTNDAPGGQMA